MWLVGLLAGGVVLVGVAAAWYWQGAEARNLERAWRLCEAENLRGAQLLFEQTVQVNPKSQRARVALAEFWDRVGSPGALARWDEALALNPANGAIRAQLVTSALRHGEIERARRAFVEFAADAQGTEEFHRLGAALAMIEGNRDEVRRHLAALVKLAPDNPRYHYNLASHGLSGEAATVAESRRVLEELARGEPLRLRATLDLMVDADRRWQGSADSETLLAARLFDGAAAVQLRAKIQSGRPRLVAHMKSQRDPDPSDAAMLLLWLKGQDRAREALEWLAGLPPSVRMHPLVLAAKVECALAIRDWKELEAALRQGAWGVVSVPVLRGAFAFRENPVVRANSWRSLIEAGQDSRQDLRVLYRLADLWQFPAEGERVLTTLVRLYPTERWAWEKLQEILLARGESLELWRHYERWINVAPGDEQVVTERLVLAFLIGRSTRELRAAANEAFVQNPREPAQAVLRALVLRSEGKAAQACALLDSMALLHAQQPRFALVHGVLLAETGRGAAATELLKLVREPLLPEERELLNHARRLAAR